LLILDDLCCNLLCIGSLQSKKSSEQRTTSFDNKKYSNDIGEEPTPNDPDENIEYHEEAENIESSIDEISHNLTRKITVIDGSLSAAKLDGKPGTSEAKQILQNSVLSEVCHG
jgi:hypothetical protein